MKQVIIAILVVVGIIGGAIFISGNKNEDTTVSASSNNWYGKEDGVITVTEYADFQCPACGQFFPLVSQVKEQFKDQVRFEFIHFPLVQIHPNATSAHRAAQAAANQGKFWEMHDLLYTRQQAWSESNSPAPVFEGYAQELGLDVEKYKIDVAAGETLAIINADISKGKALGVSATPTFYIDGKQVEDATTISTVDGFSKVIQDAIDAKQGTSSQDQPAADTPTESPQP